MWNALGSWWGGVALWLTQLPFPFQFALVIVVLVPLCLLVAYVADRVIGHLLDRVARVRGRNVSDG